MALKAEDVYAILKKQIQSGGATPEQIQQAVDAYLEENPVQPGATVEQVAQIEKNKADISSVKEDVSSLSEDIVYLSSKTASNETKAYDVTDLFTLNGFLNKRGEFVSNTVALCTDYIDAKKRRCLLFLYFTR